MNVTSFTVILLIQAIVADGQQSDFIEVTKGEPQGLILGPLVFIFVVTTL